MSSTILLVDDDSDLLLGLRVSLEGEQFEVLTSQTGEDALEIAEREGPDVMVLDVSLPGMSGIELCRTLRLRGVRTPIIMLTARSDEADRIAGLDSGADDYMTKPFSVRELIARVHAQLRRRRARSAGQMDRYVGAELEIDFIRRRLVRQGQTISLRPREAAILQLLVSQAGEVVARDRILREVWGEATEVSASSLDYHIAKLRQKLEPDPQVPRHIVSVYGEGYKFVG